MGRRPEDNFWAHLKGKFSKVKGFEAQRLESGLMGLGIPDLMYSYKGCRGMIELKFVTNFPKRSTTLVKISTLTQEQRIWLHVHGNAGGLCFLFLKIGGDYYLFNHHSAFILGELTKSQMQAEAAIFWEKNINVEQLLEALCQKQN